MQSATDVLDEVVQLFDQAISAKFSTAGKRMRDELAERGKTGEYRQALLDDLLSIITDLKIPDEEIGGLIRGEKIGWERLHAAIAQAKPRLPRDHGHLAARDASYSYLRQFTPVVLSSVRFAGGTTATELLIAVGMLRELNATGARKVFDGAPTGFVPTKWRGYLDEAPELKRNLIAVLLAFSTNLGLTRMAEASGISYDILAWTSEWYVREETLRAVNLALIDYHQSLPLTAISVRARCPPATVSGSPRAASRSPPEP